ncbi:SpoIID/LytB domain-containing protein [Candidatus Caldatribacterium sp. SIUC1]|uniref:SpoIID/LytB domain-containing protein n=1 Tax=Candidatus Caldatribacterium sp. SIUC1 TaxID=3418365 RepID=UPI003F68F7BA
MQRVLFLFVLLVLGVVFWGIAGAKDVEVRVLLVRTRDEVCLSSPSGLDVRVKQRAFVASPGRVLHFSPREGVILWQEKNLAGTTFVVLPRGECIFLGNRPYRGRLELRERGGQLEVINVLPLEEYLKGTVKLEASPSWPEEALKAYLVVARTYALKNLGRHREEGFDFCTTVHCMRYGGVFAEDPRTNALVEKTRGIIVTYQGKPASVVFHSESGGYTDSAKNVWGKDVPYLVEVPSPWEKDTPHAFWQVVVSREEITEALRRRGYIQGEVLDLECRKSEKSGRVASILVRTDREEVELSANRFREALGVDRLPSTFFDLLREPAAAQPQEEVPLQDPEGERFIDYKAWMGKDWNLDDIITFLKLREEERRRKREAQRVSSLPGTQPKKRPVWQASDAFTFVGRGWGHGVGLSQWGAVGMAKEGASFLEILHHYFPGCELGRAVVR